MKLKGVRICQRVSPTLEPGRVRKEGLSRKKRENIAREKEKHRMSEPRNESFKKKRTKDGPDITGQRRGTGKRK